MGRKLGDPADPLLVSVRSGAKFSMPGMMDTVLNLGLNDKSVKGLAKVTGDERFAYDSYRRFISMYGRIVLDVDGELLRAPARGGQGSRPASTTDAELPAAALKELCEHVQGGRQGGHRQAVPAGPDEAAARRGRGRVQQLERRPGHRLPRPRADQPRPRHRRQRADDGVRQPRRQLRHRRRLHPQRGDRREQAVRRLPRSTPRARTSWPASATPRTSTRCTRHFPKIHDELLAIFARLERALPRHVRHRVHDRAGQALDAPDPRRQAHRRGRAADGRRHDEGHRQGQAALEDQPRGGAHCGSPPTTSTRCCTRSSPARAQVIAKGLAASPGAAVGARLLHRRRRRGRRRARREGHPRAQRDEPRGRPRDDGRRGHPHRPRRPRQPRRRRRPRLGHAGRRRCRGGQDHRQVVHRRRRHRQRGRRHLARRLDAARSCSARWSSPRPSRPPSSTRSSAGPTRIRKGKLGVRANADTGEDATNARALGAEGIGLCRTEHMFLAPDRLPVVRAMILANTPDEEAAALEELREVQQDDFDGDPRGDGRPARHGAPARPAAARVPAVGRGAARSRRPPSGLDARGAGAARAPPQSWAEHNPMIGTRGVRLGVVKPGLYAMQVRALLDAAADAAQAGQEPDRRDHDPAHRHPRGAGAGPRLGARTRSTEATKGLKKKPDDHDRHDDRDAAGRDPRRRDRRGGRLLQLRHQRPDADDVRLQPRRRREPDDAGLPRAGPAQAQPVRDDRPERRRRARAHRRRARPRRPSPSSSSACAASTAATPSRSPCSTTPASTTSAARRSASRSPASPRRRPIVGAGTSDTK